MSTLQTLKDPSGEVIYPTTHEQAVLIERGENNVINLEDYREEVAEILDTCIKKLFITNKSFDETKTYSRGELVWYNNKLYFFIHSKSAGAWDSAQVEEVTNFEELFQTRKLRTPMLVGGLVQSDLEGALGGINNFTSQNSDNIDTLNTNVSSLQNSKQDKLTAGTNIGINGNTINATNTISLNFSTSEQAIGKWIDGKTIYQKTINCGALPNATSKSVSTGLSNVKTIDFFGYAYQPANGAIQPINRAETTTGNGAIVINVKNNGASVEIYCSTDRSGFTECYVTLQYTKL